MNTIGHLAAAIDRLTEENVKRREAFQCLAEDAEEWERIARDQSAAVEEGKRLLNGAREWLVYGRAEIARLTAEAASKMDAIEEQRAELAKLREWHSNANAEIDELRAKLASRGPERTGL